MNAIMGMAELILREPLTPSLREQVVTIKLSGNHLLSIINDILDLSKVESGKFEIVEAKYLFHSTIYDVVNIIKTRMVDTRTAFEVYVQNTIPNEMFGDETRIRQVLLNLLSNAFKYTRDGHFSLEITGEKHEIPSVLKRADMPADDTIILTIRVKDTGIGIKEEDLARLFAEFYRVDSERNRSIEGTGLGLSITQNIIELMGGSISATSEYGKGSEFVVTLPQKLSRRTVGLEPELAASDNDNDALMRNFMDFGDYSTFADTAVLMFGCGGVREEYITRCLTDLQVKFRSVTDTDGLRGEIARGRWDYVFAEEDLAYTALEVAKRTGAAAKVVMLTDSCVGKDVQDISVLVTPAYLFSIVSVLSGENLFIGKESAFSEHFVLPDARVLIVDDINTNLRVAEGLMRPFGMHIDTCSNGEDAILAVQENEYDIVFMDHMMPVMDGVEATQRIRALGGKFDELPIIALTANAIVGAREMFMQNRFNDFLTKPIEVYKLAAILKRWTSKEKQQQLIVFETGGADGSVSELPDLLKSEPLAPFAQVDGLNVAAGLAYSGGSAAVYAEVLATFRKDAPAKSEEMAAALESDDLGLYTIHVHALKSACAGIGAAELSDAAKKLEFAGRSADKEYISANHDEFTRELRGLLAALAEAGGSGESGELDVALLAEFGAALREFDMDAIDEVSAKLQAFADNPEADAILKAAFVGEYDDAANKIDEILKRQGSQEAAGGEDERS
jgi:CheY-like chemotaxis protein/HPt (histidine-containing phosphotransfer) domain-containing protein